MAVRVLAGGGVRTRAGLVAAGALVSAVAAVGAVFGRGFLLLLAVASAAVTTVILVFSDILSAGVLLGSLLADAALLELGAEAEAGLFGGLDVRSQTAVVFLDGLVFLGHSRHHASVWRSGGYAARPFFDARFEHLDVVCASEDHAVEVDIK
jgi:hypothetical protein